MGTSSLPEYQDAKIGGSRSGKRCRRPAAFRDDHRPTARRPRSCPGPPRLRRDLTARMLMIAAGYEDCDDVDALRTDPALKIAVGRCPETGAELMSQPTLSRLENLAGWRALARSPSESPSTRSPRHIAGLSGVALRASSSCARICPRDASAERRGMRRARSRARRVRPCTSLREVSEIQQAALPRYTSCSPG